MAFQGPKGTEDLYPKDKAAQAWLFNSLRAVAQRFGFQEIESPAFEDIKLLTAKSGEEIKKQIFVLEKKGEEEFGLRFDLTIPAARMFIQKQKELPKPVKWFYIDKMWRYERPQKGRFREFYQFGVEIFGSDKSEADAEMINVLIESLLALGLKETDFVIKLNNRKIIEGYFDQLGIKNKEAAIAILDKSRKITEEEFSKELKDAGLDKEQIEKLSVLRKPFEIRNLDYSLQSKFAFFQNQAARAGLEELEAVIKALDAFGKLPYVQIDFSTVRGLAYYTGTVFECFDIKGELRSVAGGGRYDKLVELFDGDPTPATGFAMGDKIISILLQEKGLIPETDLGPEYFIAAVSDDVRPKVLELVNKFRKKTSAEFDMMQRSLSKQIQFASTIGAKKLIVIGPDEIKKGEIKIRDMKSGKETTAKLNSL